MKIVVCVKQVPDTEASIKIGGDQKSIDENGIKFILNPYDEYAVEAALQLKEAGKAESVTTICFGPDRIVEALRTTVAMGADEAIHLKSDEVIDGVIEAKAVAAKIKELDAGMVLLGKESIDNANMQIGPMLSELLDMPCATIVNKLDVDGGSVTAEREVEGGVQVVELSTPCIITCQKGLNEPRFPAIRGVMMAKKKQIPAEEVSLDPAKATITSIVHPPARPEGKIVGEGADAVPELVRLLKEEAKVI